MLKNEYSITTTISKAIVITSGIFKSVSSVNNIEIFSLCL
ncbi:hypothetical protein E2C01_035271 [Portunus trituberculatus]|uniref:Uncharacterized protein n=1 Tax=Portunus trituberculatus TaxID=210409 RepID=A0A5B7F3S4_PORTR|nr:hypothetical protein [Portunus trituberculatus]